MATLPDTISVKFLRDVGNDYTEGQKVDLPRDKALYYYSLRFCDLDNKIIEEYNRQIREGMDIQEPESTIPGVTPNQNTLPMNYDEVVNSLKKYLVEELLPTMKEQILSELFAQQSKTPSVGVVSEFVDFSADQVVNPKVAKKDG